MEYFKNMLINILYTIGYTAYDFDTFLQKLKEYSIGAIVDVRSSPYSAFYKEFNREPLGEALKEHGIFYVFMGNELGARSKDRSVYKNGKVNFEAMEQLSSFQDGLSRLRNGLEKYPIALMCSEKDPLQCHRAILICKALRSGYTITHIWPYLDATNNLNELESHSQLEERLQNQHNPSKQAHLLFNKEAELKDAYKKQASVIAFTEEVTDDGQYEH